MGSNRFLNTGFFKSPFVRSLKGSLKTLYLYIICDCDGSGIWAVDLEIASKYTGFNQRTKDFEVFITAHKAIDLKNGKFFFPDFIEHQYPKGLNENNPAHTNFITELKKHNLLDDKMCIVLGTPKPLESPSEGTKVMVMVTEEVMVKATVMETDPQKLIFPFQSEPFMKVWNLLVKEKKWRNKSPAALQASLKKLSRYSESDAIEMMNDSIAGEWQGLFEPKKSTNGNTNSSAGKRPRAWGNGLDHLNEHLRQQAAEGVKHTS